MMLSNRLYEAVIQDNLQEVRNLIDNGANVNMRNGRGKTPLYVASMSGYLQVVELLLQSGANVNKAKPITGETPSLLHLGRAIIQ
jgi:ankyrin repeat protein